MTPFYFSAMKFAPSPPMENGVVILSGTPAEYAPAPEGKNDSSRGKQAHLQCEPDLIAWDGEIP